MANKTKPKVGGDVLISHLSDLYSVESGTVKMPASGGAHDVAQVAGMPAVWDATNKRATLVLNAAVNTTTCLVLHGPALASKANDFETTDKYTIVFNPEGCVINKNAIPTTDSAGTTITLATLVTQLETLGFKVVADPVKKSTQTT